jgi:hypothetical protein
MGRRRCPVQEHIVDNHQGTPSLVVHWAAAAGTNQPASLGSLAVVEGAKPWAEADAGIGWCRRCRRQRRRRRRRCGWSKGTPQAPPGTVETHSGRSSAQPDPLARTIRPDVTYARDIEEDPMLEEFVASLASGWPVGRDSSKRLPSPPSEALVVVPIVAATTLEDQDPTASDSGAL